MIFNAIAWEAEINYRRSRENLRFQDNCVKRAKCYFKRFYAPSSCSSAFYLHRKIVRQIEVSRNSPPPPKVSDEREKQVNSFLMQLSRRLIATRAIIFASKIIALSAQSVASKDSMLCFLTIPRFIYITKSQVLPVKSRSAEIWKEPDEREKERNKEKKIIFNAIISKAHRHSRNDPRFQENCIKRIKCCIKRFSYVLFIPPGF